MLKTLSNKYNIFYGWFVVLGGLLIMFTIGGVAWNCVSLYIKPVCAELGFTRGQMSVNQTITSLVNMAVSLSWGYILQHFSLKKLMRLAAFLLPVAYFGYSMSRAIWMFYACSLLLGLSLALLMTLPLSMIVSNWFEEKRGLAMGITFMGSGLGGMVFSPIVSTIITDFGWRAAYRSMSFVMFAAAIAAVFFLIKMRPEEMGLRALGYEKHHHMTESGEEEDDEEGDFLPFKQLIRTTRFKVVAVALCFSNTAVGCITQCLVPHLSDNGYSAATAALMMSVGMGALAIGKMSLGVIYDRVGTRVATILAMSCGLMGVISMVFCRFPAALCLIFFGQGIGCSFGTVGVPIVTQSLFGKKDYGYNFGFISACSSAVGALSPIINGTVYDKTGSYDPAFIAWAVILTVGISIFWVVLPRDKKSKA